MHTSVHFVHARELVTLSKGPCLGWNEILISLFSAGLCGNTHIISRVTAMHNCTFRVLVVEIEIAMSSGFCVFLELWSHFCLWKPRNNSLTLFKFPQASLFAFNMDCFSCKQEFFALAGYEARPVATFVLFLKDHFLWLNLFLCSLRYGSLDLQAGLAVFL